MSGICGIVTLDGSPVDHDELLGMARLLEHRGPDGMTQWFGDGVALSNASLVTTPEAAAEAQPFRHRASGCVITADVRLDNRKDLFERLGLGPSHRGMGDAELILLCYLKWGSDCARNLLGDFAFAIWDPRSRRLFAARDHMGVRQVSWWHQAGKALIFATEPQAILACQAVPVQVNQGAIADYLDNLSAPDFEATWFEGIYRLPPGHRLELSAGGLQIAPYWKLGPADEQRGLSYDEYCEGLRSVLTEAVHCRLRSHKPVGATLSGGMDSGAVCAIAGQLLAAGGRPLLQTYSCVGPDPGTCIETRSIQIASGMPGLDPHMLGFAEMAEHIAQSGGIAGPCAEPRELFMTVIRALYHAASGHGVNVLLDGVNGDVAFAVGNHLPRLVSQGNLVGALKSARGASGFWHPDVPMPQAVASALWQGLVPHAIRERRGLGIYSQKAARIESDTLVAPAFADRVQLTQRRIDKRPETFWRKSSPAEERLKAVTRIECAEGNQMYDQVAARNGIERRDPFCDIRVIQYCLAIPSGFVERNGWPKHILRDAMAGLVPGEVRWRKGKQHLGYWFTQSLFAEGNNAIDNPQRAREILEPYVKPSALQIFGAATQQSASPVTRLMLCSMASWLIKLRKSAPQMERANREPEKY